MQIENDTIAAIATSNLPAGVAIIRVSGHETRKALSKIFFSKQNPEKLPRYLVHGKFKSAEGKLLDSGLASFMPGPKSFTGEDCAELHLHGNPLICKQILRELFKYQIRLAEPGEFTKRAYLNGKMDLIQAEAVAQVISAQSERALALAQEHHNGTLSKSLQTIGEPLRNLLAEIEAHIDFPEEDISPDNQQRLINNLEETKKAIQGLLATYDYGLLVKDGYKVLLCGKPNVGKSSILNTLLGYDRAIVSNISGTTRDTLEEELNLAGYKIRLCDTAGIRETEDIVEQLGVQRSHERVNWADLVLLIYSLDTLDSDTEINELIDFYQKLKNNNKSVYLIKNKIDLQELNKNNNFKQTLKPDLEISTQLNTSIEQLKLKIIQEIQKHEINQEQSNVIVQERHRLALEQADNAVTTALLSLKTNKSFEYVSADLRYALNQLAEIVGQTHTEDILGRIFSKFCIGK